MNYRRSWDADEWQKFGLQIVQLRHGAENVQCVPDKVKGDAGIEFFSVDGCLYQCYAPEEVADVGKAASAMKAKAARDLQKLIKYKEVISNLLQQTKARRWILLCPFLDDKDVVAAVRKNGEAIKQAGLQFIAPDFEALIQSQDDFTTEIEHLKALSLGPALILQTPTDAEVQKATTDDMSIRLTEKLQRAFPAADATQINRQRESYIRSHVTRENALETLKSDHPALWEKSIKVLNAEEERLVAVGTASAIPSTQLEQSISRIEKSLKADLPGLATSSITHIAVGTVSDWLLRCPLDFPSAGSK